MTIAQSYLSRKPAIASSGQGCESTTAWPSTTTGTLPLSKARETAGFTAMLRTLMLEPATHR